MRALHGDYRKGTIAPHPSQFGADVPDWVAETGLEWLYELILRSESFFKAQTIAKR